MEAKLLTRNEFREGVFARDNHTCVVPDCNKEAVDAHHIIERKLCPGDTISTVSLFALTNEEATCKPAKLLD